MNARFSEAPTPRERSAASPDLEVKVALDTVNDMLDRGIVSAEVAIKNLHMAAKILANGSGVDKISMQYGPEFAQAVARYLEALSKKQTINN